MNDISIYFEPVHVTPSRLDGTIGSKCEVHDQTGFPDLSAPGIVILSVPEYRNADQKNRPLKELFRKQLYELYVGDNWTKPIYDLGVIQPGKEFDDTFFALSQTISELVKNDFLPVVIGGSQDLTLACYKGYEALEQMINICAVDAALDIGDPSKPIRNNGFVSHLLMQRPCYLFNYANIGLQRPLVKRADVELFDKLYFDICRLGELNSDTKLAEPILRNSDVLTLDFEVIKSSETDSTVYPNVNGLYAEQVCQIAKYAGISDKLSTVGIFNLAHEHNSAAANLLAQFIWYFMDGVAQRVGDFPIGSKKNYTKFHVDLDDFQDELVFYKSNKSNRWWLEVKYNAGNDNKYERHSLVPCNYEDYQKAMENQIPDLWWKTLQKLT